MSTQKKLTPLQEAIEQFKNPRNSAVICVLEKLLPKEKEFAIEMWDNGWREGL